MLLHEESVTGALASLEKLPRLLFNSSRTTHRCRAVGPQNTNCQTKALGNLYFAGPRGIEPRPTDLEAVVLPLNYRPVQKILTQKRSLCDRFCVRK